MLTNPKVKQGSYSPPTCLTPYLLSELGFSKNRIFSIQNLNKNFNKESLPQVHSYGKIKSYWEGYRFFLKEVEDGSK